MGSAFGTDWKTDEDHTADVNKSSSASSSSSSSSTASYDSDERGPPKGTDVTFTVGDLLKKTTRKMNYGPTPNITVEKIPVPGGYLIHNVLSEDECKQYIEMSEEMGYAPAPLRNLDEVNSNSFSYNDDTKNIRTSLRVLFDAPDDIGVELNRRVAAHLPQELDCDGRKWRLSTENDLCGGCINKRWRFNKYRKGDFFKPHFDAGFVFSPKEATLLTMILYLNEGFEGGETIFYPGNKKLAWTQPEPGIEFKVVPKRGSVLVFFQKGKENPRHEGATQLSDNNFKYILRSDVGYVVLDNNNNNKQDKDK